MYIFEAISHDMTKKKSNIYHLSSEDAASE